MPKPNPENEVAKRAYLRWLENAHGRDEATVDQAAAALARFEAHNGRKDFKSFNPEQAISFKRHLAGQRTAAGKPLAKATAYATLRHLKAFFEWLSREPGYKRHVRFCRRRLLQADRQRRPGGHRAATEPLPLAATDSPRVGRHANDNADPAARPGSGGADRLNWRARRGGGLAADAPPGPRSPRAGPGRPRGGDRAGQDLPHGLLSRRRRGRSYIARLGAGTDHRPPVRPRRPAVPRHRRLAGRGRACSLPAGSTGGTGLTLTPSGASSRSRSRAPALPYFNPHSLRQTIMRLSYDLNLSPRELKAWSQNLGHESVHTSLTSYGRLPDEEQVEVLAAIDPNNRGKGDVGKVLAWLQRKMAEETAMAVP